MSESTDPNHPHRGCSIRAQPIPGSERPTTAGSAHDSSDDTIEVELTREQQLALSRAAGSAHASSDDTIELQLMGEQQLALSRAAGSAHASSNDTIEVELTGEQQLALSRAAEAARATARPDESGPVLSVTKYANFASRRTARVDFVCNVTLAVAGLSIAVGFLWPAPASDANPPAPAVTTAALAPASSRTCRAAGCASPGWTCRTAGCACANKKRLRCDGGIRVSARDHRIRSPRGGCRAALKPCT